MTEGPRSIEEGAEEDRVASAEEVPDPSAEPVDREEVLYQLTVAALAAPPRVDRTSTARVLFFLSLAIYILYRLLFAGREAADVPLSVGLLVGGILLHEMGHYAGMLLFGYRDLKVFFIPFLGAAASGRKHAAPLWQQSVVALLGPVPGIVLAAVLQATLRPPPGSALHSAEMVLLAINVFNLLPLVPLDGGRLLQMVIFSRSPILEAAFLVLASLGLGWIAYTIESEILMLVGLLGLLRVPNRFQVARRRSLLRTKLAGFPERLEDLSDQERRALFRLAGKVDPASAEPQARARQMRQLHEEIVVRPPSLKATSLLLLTYAAAIGLGLFASYNVTVDAVRGERGAQGLIMEVERFKEESQRIRKELDANAEKRKAGGPEAKALRREGDRLRAELIGAVERTIDRLEDADPAVRALALNGEENARAFLDRLRQLRSKLREDERPGARDGGAEKPALPERGK